MNKALMGYTGFVGSNILLKSQFNFKYNSKNINEIHNKEFDLLICSSITADMQLANTNPQKDLENIQNMLNILKTVKANKAVLISTISIYPQPVNYNENDINLKSDNDYGINRKFAEDEFKKIFNDSYIIRLPSLFGENLKKNFIYDIINPEPSFFTFEKFESIKNKLKNSIVLEYYNYDSDKKRYIFNKNKAIANNLRKEIQNTLFSINETSLQFTNYQSTFQFYNLNRLYDDIIKAIDNNIKILNICSEPISASKIMKDFFNINFCADKAKLYNYNMKSIYSHLWNNKNNYLYTEYEIYRDLKTFFIENGVLK